MIIVKTILSAHPEKQKEVMQTLLSMIEPPANGNGLLSYGIYHNIDDATVFELISEWENRRHVNVHLSSDRFGVLLGTRSLLCQPIDIQILTVTNVEGMDAVRKARSKTEE
jgi:quinol monooxygenase YgiN